MSRNHIGKGWVWPIMAVLLVVTFAPTAQPTLAVASLKVLYRAYSTGANVREVAPGFQLINLGTSTADLSTVKIRYWYTADAANPSQIFTCEWVQIGCTKVTGRFAHLAKPVSGADYYLEVGFSGASLPAGANSGPIQVRFHKSDRSSYAQDGDYSFDPKKIAFADWMRITLYQNGVLIWGVEPDGSGVITPGPVVTPVRLTATNTPTRTSTPTPSIPSWSGNFVPYHIGDLVSYGGSIYRCIQAHASQPDWTPPATPALWTLQTGPTPTAGPSYTPTLTRTRTGTPSPGASATPNRTPTFGPSPTPTPTASGGTSGVTGYFASWGVYGRNYHVKNIVSSGSAGQLTHINYAFANISSNLRCAIGDPYADYDRFYSASQSVDGVADTWDAGALRGSFNQLRKLKILYPNIKVLISIGGWTWSDRFSDAALPANRAAFVASCINTFIQGNFAPGLSYPGIFDGIDVDWEYPGTCGNTCNYRTEDTQNFTALLAEFRSQLDGLSLRNRVREWGEDEAGMGTHPHPIPSPYLLTIAAPVGEDKFTKIELGNIPVYLNSINLMAYDMHGAWESTTNFNAPLYGSSGDPSPPPINHYYADYAVQAYKDAGVPAGKIVLGVPFYGRGWTNVPNANNGLYQHSTSPAPGTYEPGIEDYKVLKNLTGYGAFRHPEAQAFWVFNGSTFWSYDDPASITNKMAYVRSQGLGGAMFWEFSGDDAAGSLISAIANGLTR